MELNVEKLYNKYGPMVLRRCRSLLKDEEKALDAMQEVFVKLIVNKKKLREDYPSGLLYRIATNVCLNIIRSEKRKPEDGSDELLYKIASHERTEKKVIASDYVMRIFGKEKESTKVMAVMHYVDRMTLKEVAGEVGLSVSGVRKRLREFKARVSKDEKE